MDKPKIVAATKSTWDFTNNIYLHLRILTNIYGRDKIIYSNFSFIDTSKFSKFEEKFF